MMMKILKYFLPVSLLLSALGVRGERKEIPQFTTLVLVGNVNVNYTIGDYPGYIEFSGSEDDITSIWSDSKLTIIVGGGVKDISIKGEGLNKVILTGNTTFTSAGKMDNKNVILTAVGEGKFVVPAVYANRMAVSLSNNSSAVIGEALCDDLAITAVDGSNVDVTGIDAETVSVVAGVGSVVTLSGSCVKKNEVLINSGTIDARSLKEKDPKSRTNSDITPSEKDNVPVTVPI